MHSGESLLAALQPTDDSTPFKNKDIQQKNVACLLSVCHRTLHWQPATHTHSILMAIFPGEPGLAGAPDSLSPFIPGLRILLGQT